MFEPKKRRKEPKSRMTLLREFDIPKTRKGKIRIFEVTPRGRFAPTPVSPKRRKKLLKGRTRKR
jgi:hypothetical protein